MKLVVDRINILSRIKMSQALNEGTAARGVGKASAPMLPSCDRIRVIQLLYKDRSVQIGIDLTYDT